MDDFAITCEDQDQAKQIIQDINANMTISVKELGLVKQYNGVNVEQTKEYIKIHNTTYIDKLLAQHFWLANDEVPLHTHPLPMNSDNKYQKQLINSRITRFSYST